jgi:hypothetical protein
MRWVVVDHCLEYFTLKPHQKSSTFQRPKEHQHRIVSLASNYRNIQMAPLELDEILIIIQIPCVVVHHCLKYFTLKQHQKSFTFQRIKKYQPRAVSFGLNYQNVQNGPVEFGEMLAII